MKGPVGELLEQKFVDWQREARERRTLEQFAEYLGVSRDALNKWMNGKRQPSEGYIELVAAKLGPEIYDVLGLPRPDPLLQAVIRGWPNASDDLKREVAERVGGYAPDDSGERRPAGKRDRRVERSE